MSTAQSLIEGVKSHRKNSVHFDPYLTVPGQKESGRPRRAQSGTHPKAETHHQKHDPKSNDSKKTNHNGIDHKDGLRPQTTDATQTRRRSVSLSTKITDGEPQATAQTKKGRRLSMSEKATRKENKADQQKRFWNNPRAAARRESHNVTIIIQDGKIVERRSSIPSLESEGDAVLSAIAEGSRGKKIDGKRSKSPSGAAPVTSPPASPVKDEHAAEKKRDQQKSPARIPHKKRSWSLPGAFGSENKIVCKADAALLTMPSSPSRIERTRSDSLPKRGKSGGSVPDGVKVDFFPDIQPPVYYEDGHIVPSSPLAFSRGIYSRFFDLGQQEAVEGGEKAPSDLPSPRRIWLPGVHPSGDSPRNRHKIVRDDSNRRHSLFVLNPTSFGKLTRRTGDTYVTIDDLRPTAKFEILAKEPEEQIPAHLPENWKEEMMKCRYLRMPKELAARLGYDWL